MKTKRYMLPYLLCNALAFYLLPLVIQDTGSAMLVLLLGIPLLCVIISLVFGVKHAFHWTYPLAVACLFVPTIFLYYNESAAFYTVAYGLLALAGSFIGTLFHKTA